MWFSGETYEKAYYQLESKFPVTGLNEQALVRFRGVDIGKVTSIQFDPANVRTILIDIAIRSDVKLTRSSFAELRYQGVTGLSYVMLDDPGTIGADHRQNQRRSHDQPLSDIVVAVLRCTPEGHWQSKHESRRAFRGPSSSLSAARRAPAPHAPAC